MNFPLLQACIKHIKMLLANNRSSFVQPLKNTQKIMLFLSYGFRFILERYCVQIDVTLKTGYKLSQMLRDELKDNRHNSKFIRVFAIIGAIQDLK